MTLLESNISDFVGININNKIGELDKIEKRWEAEQEELLEVKIKRQKEQSYKEEERWGLMLKKCKNHGGPLDSLVDLDNFIKSHKHDEKALISMLRSEIVFRRLSTVDQTNLDFKVNKKNSNELALTLKLLIENDEKETNNDHEKLSNLNEILNNY